MLGCGGEGHFEPSPARALHLTEDHRRQCPVGQLQAAVVDRCLPVGDADTGMVEADKKVACAHASGGGRAAQPEGNGFVHALCQP